MNVTIERDKQANAAYIRLTHNAVETTQDFGMVLLDLDSENAVIGIELREVRAITQTNI